MINLRLTAGVLISTMLVGNVPATALASTGTAEDNYITAMTGSFSAGAHAAIGETVVLEDIFDDTLADVTENEAPIVTEPEQGAVEEDVLEEIPEAEVPETEAEPEVPAEEDKQEEEKKPEVVNPYANIAIADVNEYLNIRAEANQDAKVLGKLYVNGAAIVLEKLDGWYKVKSGKVTGYVSAKYVIVGDEEACKKASTTIATVTANTLRLRKSASTDAGVYTLLSKGNKLTVVGETEDGWLKVKYKSYTGYISADYAKVETIYTYAESKEEEAARIEKEKEEERKAQEKAEAEKKKEEAANKKYKAPAGKSGKDVATYAKQFIGNRYVWGGTSLTKGVDCSGFVMKVYEAFGVSLPHSSYRLRSVGYKVSESEMKPGDIICYSGHVAIYIGNGKIVHASNKKDGIKITNNYKYKKVLAIRRIF